MADSFSRDSLAAYEKNPQKTISDKVNPFRGATPAQAASAAALAAVAAGDIDATPGGAPQRRAAAPDPLTDDSPVVDEDGTLGDSTDSSEGTSEDVNPEDSSDSAVEPGDETDPNEDLTGEVTAEDTEEPVRPKKGSAAERIVEVLDLAEGYKEYGKMKDAQVQELAAEIERLRGGAPAAASTAAPPAVVEDEPMPDMADADIAFDNDKYRAKMSKWVKGQTAAAARAAVREVTGADNVAKAMQAVETKVETFAKDHADFDTVVRKNKVLAQNPLGPDAGVMIQESEFTADLLYQFGKDPGLAIRTARMTPRQQVAQVTRMIVALEEKSAAAKKNPQGGAKPAQKKSITQAPPPPRPTQGGGRAAPRESTDPNMSMDEFARQHRTGKQSAREAARKGRGLN